MAKKEEIILGSGDLYYAEFDGATIPEDSTLEVEEKRAGHIKGGAAIEYKPSFYEASDDFKRVTKSILTEEVATMKLGLITWAENVLEALISTARKSTTSGKVTYKIGGIKNANGKKYLWRFVHTKDDGKKIRITVTGKNQGGVSITFAKDKETTVDPEITAEPLDAEGTLIIFDEEVQAE